MRARRIAILLVLLPMAARAHSGEPLAPHDLWTAWDIEPGAAVPLFITALLYARGARFSRGVSRRQVAAFWSGWTVLALALLSPLHPLGEVLFSAHMLQHELLMLAAAPLLVLSRPLVPMLWGVPLSWRRGLGGFSKTGLVQRMWHFSTAPFAAWAISGIALWVWHAPQLFQATLENEWIHTAQHLSFFLSALLFWWSLFYSRSPASYGASVLSVFTTALHTSILGALLTFAPVLWYPAYRETVSAWHLTPLEDQQIGGLIMWVPAGLVYIAAGLVLFAAWLRESDAMVRRSSYAD